MYREVRQRENDLADQVRVAAMASDVSAERIATYFPELIPHQGAAIMPETLSAEEAVGVVDVDDDFEGETIFTMDADEALAILADMGQAVTMADLEGFDGPS